MAFSSKRGRPRKPPAVLDLGTPELRLKHAVGLTAEPIDLCLARKLIDEAQHWCALHLRWLHTLRYGAPPLTTRYTDRGGSPPVCDDATWRAGREQEYADAVTLLRTHRCERPVIRLAIFNEAPPFLDLALCKRAWGDASLARRLDAQRRELDEGLALLSRHWRRETVS
ncbi:MAG: hypothetical protein WDN72_04545 [Alphaproteobacteria bacterium]